MLRIPSNVSVQVPVALQDNAPWFLHFLASNFEYISHDYVPWTSPLLNYLCEKAGRYWNGDIRLRCVLCRADEGSWRAKYLSEELLLFHMVQFHWGWWRNLNWGILETPCLYSEWAAIQHSDTVPIPSIDDMYPDSGCSSPLHSQHILNFRDEEDTGSDTTEDMEDFLCRSNMNAEDEDSPI